MKRASDDVRPSRAAILWTPDFARCTLWLRQPVWMAHGPLLPSWTYDRLVLRLDGDDITARLVEEWES